MATDHVLGVLVDLHATTEDVRLPRLLGMREAVGLLADRLAIPPLVRTKKPAKKKKIGRTKPDKYSDGPRQTKMKKPRGGGGAKRLGGFDEDY